MSGSDEDLNQYLDGVAEKVNADFRTHEAAAKNAEKKRQDFIQDFRDLSDRVIMPEFKKAERATEAMTIKAKHSKDSTFSELSITMKTSNENSVSGFLRYRADLDRRQFMREGHVDRLPQRRESFAVFHEHLTPEEVEKEIRLLVHDVQFALENKRP